MTPDLIHYRGYLIRRTSIGEYFVETHAGELIGYCGTEESAYRAVDQTIEDVYGDD